MFISSPPELNNRILCYYKNLTKQMQMIRITNIPNWNFEKVVFPQQRLMFEAYPEANLKVYREVMGILICSEQIQCNLLCVKEKANLLKKIVFT